MNNIDISLEVANGNGTIIYNKNGIKFTYTGNIVNEMDGSGFLESKLFTITGIFKNDFSKRNKILPDGSIYLGELMNLVIVMEMEYKTPFGKKYSGKWVNNYFKEKDL